MAGMMFARVRLALNRQGMPHTGRSLSCWSMCPHCRGYTLLPPRIPGKRQLDSWHTRSPLANPGTSQQCMRHMRWIQDLPRKSPQDMQNRLTSPGPHNRRKMFLEDMAHTWILAETRQAGIPREEAGTIFDAPRWDAGSVASLLAHIHTTEGWD